MSGIYIHIPFCHSKCFYCDFYSTPKLFDPMGYAEALKREFHLRHNEIDMPPGTIYLGGGTPSIFPEKALQAIFDFLPLEHAEEMTIEVNPEDVTDRFARFLADSPVNRVSMGVQTMNDQELKAIGRRHSSYDTSKAIERLRHAGINNLSLDLIYGLPGQTIESWKQSLTSVLNLRPEHLSAYSLMLEPGTRLWAMKQAGRLPEVAEEDGEQMYVMLCEMTRESGFNHYLQLLYSRISFAPQFFILGSHTLSWAWSIGSQLRRFIATCQPIKPPRLSIRRQIQSNHRRSYIGRTD